MICLSFRHKEPPATEVLGSVLVKLGPEWGANRGLFRLLFPRLFPLLFLFSPFDFGKHPGVYPASSRSVWLEPGEGWLLLIPALGCSGPARPGPAAGLPSSAPPALALACGLPEDPRPLRLRSHLRPLGHPCPYCPGSILWDLLVFCPSTWGNFLL